MPQETSGHLHAGGLQAVWVALQPAAKLAQGRQLLHRKEPSPGEGRVQQWSSMALGEDEAITVGPLWPVRINAQLVKVEDSNDLCWRQGAPGVP